MLGLARSVYHAPHYRHLHFLDTGVSRAPVWHLLAQVFLDVVRHLLKERACGASTPRACGHLWREATQAQGLQHLLCDEDFFCAVAAGARRERYADGIADSFGEHEGQGRRRRDDSLHAKAGLGEAEMQRVIATRSKFSVAVKQVLHLRDLGGDDDAVVRQAGLFRERCRPQRTLDHRFHIRMFSIQRFSARGVLVHHRREQVLIERAPVHADPHGLVAIDCDLNDRPEVFVPAFTSDVARVDSVLCQRLRTSRILCEQEVPVVMKVADDGSGDPAIGDPRYQFGEGLGGVVVVDGDPHELGASACQGNHLIGGRSSVGRVGVRHRLDDDGMRRAHSDGADKCADGFSAFLEDHGNPQSGVAAGIIMREVGEYVFRAAFPALPFHLKDQRMPTPDDTPAPQQPEPEKSFCRRHWGALSIAAVLLVPTLVFIIWSGVTLSYTYSSGMRVGFVQKFSKKGWLCKTWEGELAMVNMPGAMSQIFTFSVRNDSVATAINEAMGKGRVEVQYEEHRGVPSSCFGETSYFVKGVRSIPG